MSEVVKMKHFKAPDHRSVFATAMSAAKTGDGTLQMVFYRDSVNIADEDLTLSEAIDPQNPPKGAIQVLSSSANIEQTREDVITVIIPISAIDGFAKLLANLNQSE